MKILVKYLPLTRVCKALFQSVKHKSIRDIEILLELLYEHLSRNPKMANSTIRALHGVLGKASAYVYNDNTAFCCEHISKLWLEQRDNYNSITRARYHENMLTYGTRSKKKHEYEAQTNSNNL